MPFPEDRESQVVAPLHESATTVSTYPPHDNDLGYDVRLVTSDNPERGKNDAIGTPQDGFHIVDTQHDSLASHIKDTQFVNLEPETQVINENSMSPFSKLSPLSKKVLGNIDNGSAIESFPLGVHTTPLAIIERPKEVDNVPFCFKYTKAAKPLIGQPNKALGGKPLEEKIRTKPLELPLSTTKEHHIRPNSNMTTQSDDTHSGDTSGYVDSGDMGAQPMGSNDTTIHEPRPALGQASAGAETERRSIIQHGPPAADTTQFNYVAAQISSNKGYQRIKQPFQEVSPMLPHDRVRQSTRLERLANTTSRQRLESSCQSRRSNKSTAVPFQEVAHNKPSPVAPQRMTESNTSSPHTEEVCMAGQQNASRMPVFATLHGVDSNAGQIQCIITGETSEIVSNNSHDIVVHHRAAAVRNENLQQNTLNVIDHSTASRESYTEHDMVAPQHLVDVPQTRPRGGDGITASRRSSPPPSGPTSRRTSQPTSQPQPRQGEHFGSSISRPMSAEELHLQDISRFASDQADNQTTKVQNLKIKENQKARGIKSNPALDMEAQNPKTGEQDFPQIRKALDCLNLDNIYQLSKAYEDQLVILTTQRAKIDELQRTNLNSEKQIKLLEDEKSNFHKKVIKLADHGKKYKTHMNDVLISRENIRNSGMKLASDIKNLKTATSESLRVIRANQEQELHKNEDKRVQLIESIKGPLREARQRLDELENSNKLLNTNLNERLLELEREQCVSKNLQEQLDRRTIDQEELAGLLAKHQSSVVDDFKKQANILCEVLNCGNSTQMKIEELSNLVNDLKNREPDLPSKLVKQIDNIYTRIEEKLQALDGIIIVNHESDLKAFDDIKQRIAQIHSDNGITELRETNSSLADSMNTHGMELQAVTKELENLGGVLAEYRSELTAKTTLDLEQKNSLLQDQLLAARGDVERVKKELTSLRETPMVSQEQLRKVQDKLCEAEGKIQCFSEEKEQYIEDSTLKYEKCRQDIVEAANAQKAEMIIHHDAIVKTLEQQIAEFETQLRLITEEMEKAQKKCSTTIDLVSGLQKELSSCQSRLVQQQGHVSQVEQAAIDRKADEGREEDIQRIQKNILELKQQCEETHRAAYHNIDTARRDIRQAESKLLSIHLEEGQNWSPNQKHNALRTENDNLNNFTIHRPHRPQHQRQDSKSSDEWAKPVSPIILLNQMPRLNLLGTSNIEGLCNELHISTLPGTVNQEQTVMWGQKTTDLGTAMLCTNGSNKLTLEAAERSALDMPSRKSQDSRELHGSEAVDLIPESAIRAPQEPMQQPAQPAQPTRRVAERKISAISQPRYTENETLIIQENITHFPTQTSRTSENRCGSGRLSANIPDDPALDIRMFSTMTPIANSPAACSLSGIDPVTNEPESTAGNEQVEKGYENSCNAKTIWRQKRTKGIRSDSVSSDSVISMEIYERNEVPDSYQFSDGEELAGVKNELHKTPAVSILSLDGPEQPRNSSQKPLKSALKNPRGIPAFQSPHIRSPAPSPVPRVPRQASSHSVKLNRPGVSNLTVNFSSSMSPYNRVVSGKPSKRETSKFNPQAQSIRQHQSPASQQTSMHEAPWSPVIGLLRRNKRGASNQMYSGLPQKRLRLSLRSSSSKEIPDSQDPPHPY